MEITKKLVRFAMETSYSSFPTKVVHQGKRCFIDLLGVAIGGSNGPLVRILEAFVKEFDGNPQSTILGGGGKTTVLNAAFINGAMAHALDYDETHTGANGHTSASLLPAVLAVAEWKNLSGKSALEAYILGFEVAARIGIGLGKQHYDKGWHGTSTWGRFGGAIAAGKLLGLSCAEMTQAMGLAGTQACGLRIVFGTMTKPFHAGKAAYDGVISAVLAQRGLSCAPDILEGKNGFMQVLGENSSLELMVKSLGKKYEIMNVSFKPYASCLITHHVIDALLKLRNEHSVQSQEVVEIQCSVSPRCLDIAGQENPLTGLAGKFSIHYCAALAVAEGVAGEEMFTDERVLDPRMIDLRKKVKVFGTPELKTTEANVSIITRDGNKFSTFMDCQKGDPEHPLTDHEIEQKFLSLTSPVLSKRKSSLLLSKLWNIEKADNIRQIIRLCC